MIAMLFTLLFVACGLGGGGAPECVDNGECGELQACIEQSCEDVECVTSDTCEIGRFCDTERYVCRDGCASDEDCLAGQECAGSTCQDKPCRNSELDCTAGETCNPNTGGCEPPIVGTTLGRCQLTRHLGSGQTSEVFLARHRTLQVQVVPAPATE